MAETPAAKDPRFRPYRVAAYLVYLAVVIAFSSLIIVSVVRSVIAMTPPKLAASDTTLTVGECLERGDALWTELDRRRRDLGDRERASAAGDDWAEFRLSWLRRLREADSRCALESHQRTALKSVFAHLEHAMDLYTTHAVQFSGEIGPTVDAMRAARARARQEGGR